MEKSRNRRVRWDLVWLILGVFLANLAVMHLAYLTLGA
jgi:hypothetical protein